MSDEQPVTPDAQPQPQPTPPPSQPTSQSPPTQPTKETTSTPSTSEPKSLLNQEAPKGAPEKYSEFKVPDGYELDADVAKEVQPLFKDMNLSQDQAQKLVDFYVKSTQESLRQPYEAYEALREEWRGKAKSHPEIGGNFDRVLTTVARAIDSVGDAEL